MVAGDRAATAVVAAEETLAAAAAWRWQEEAMTVAEVGAAAALLVG